ncbi:hypothetical protein ACFO0N_08930 [Halobium salinum]|uniref:RDD family protein n=1 Tax=Halobium salinum TaxID=1364940 RepID=A0ABD5PC76_9EURY|nr:hypothetical protein [Halobium salinum]
MARSRYRSFILGLLALDVVAVGVGTVLSAVLGLEALVAFGLPLLVAPVVAYWVAYRTDLLVGGSGIQ